MPTTNTKTNFDPDRMTTIEAAEYLGLSDSTLEGWRWQKKRGTPKHYRIGHYVYYRQRDLDAYIDRNTVTL